jgi:hypothetical protein
MNLQEATRAGAVFWLRAGRTVKEIMSYGDFNKNTEAVDMNGRFQMQGGKNWILPK